MSNTSVISRARLVGLSLVVLAAAYAPSSAHGQALTHAMNWGGGGYTDVSPKQVVRTSGNIAYLIATNCDNYPCVDASQTVRVWKADSVGVPSTFTRQDSAHEPVNTGAAAAAIDASDTIHIVWQQRSGGVTQSIMYTTFNTATGLWGTAFQAVETGLGSAQDIGQGDSFMALALDANGKPHVAYLYWDGAMRHVGYKNRVSGSWSARTTIDDNVYNGNEKAWLPNIAFDTSGRRVFAWLTGAFNEDTNGSIRVRVMDIDGTLGTRADVSLNNSKVGIDQGTSLLCNGMIHIAWILNGPPSTTFVQYAYAPEGKNPTFTLNNPAGDAQSPSPDTHDPSLGLGGPGKIRIYGHGSTPAGGGTANSDNENLYYWEGTGGGGTWSARLPYVLGGSHDASVSTRWSQYFYNYPLTLDVDYWDDNYPNILYYGADVIAGCPAATVAPLSQTFGDTGTGTPSPVVGVTMSAGCAWTAVSNAPWITVTAGAGGSGNGTVTFAVAPDLGPGHTTRIGTLTVAGQTVTITETGPTAPSAPTNLQIKVGR
jgi:hypothetical protein